MIATKTVAVAAHSGDYTESQERAVKLFVSKLAERCPGAAILVGGYWGLMRVVVDEALARGLTVVILPPVEREHVVFPERAIVIKTGASYRLRSVILARSCDVLVALGGGAGVVQEAVTAYNEGKTVFLLKTGMDSDKLEALGPYLDYRRLAPIRVYEDPARLALDLCDHLESAEPQRLGDHG